MISAPLFYVCGNHDIRHGSKPPQGGINLHARLLSFKGLNMLGLEGSMWYNGGPYQYTESEMRRMVRGLRIGIWWQGGVDVVIAHAPPRGIYDDQDLCHQGFETFRWLIQKYKPRYFIHGHIHRFFNEPWERVTTVGETQVINAYGCHILEIDDRKSNQ
jgi:Icc-related predicted phosphoesterase